MTKRYSTMALAALTVLTMAACGTGGGLGDIFGGGGSTNELRGRVDYVDTANRFVVLTNVSGYGNMLSAGSGQTLRVYYDNQTPVEYQGRSYQPTDLERGDEIAVQFDQSGNNVVARSMTVLYDSRSAGSNYPGGNTGGNTGGNYPGGSYDTTVRGTVRYVDTSRRTIEIDRGGYGGVQTVEFDNSTYVTSDGRNYRLQDLRRGDEVDIRVRDIGNGRLIATDINVVRGGGSGSYSTSQRTVRGTVRYVDTARREIGLDQTSWISGFTTGGGSGAGGTMVIRYDTNTNVEYGGQFYPPTNLERGDVVDVHVQETGSSTFLANRIMVVRDVNRR